MSKKLLYLIGLVAMGISAVAYAHPSSFQHEHMQTAEPKCSGGSVKSLLAQAEGAHFKVILLRGANLQAFDIAMRPLAGPMPPFIGALLVPDVYDKAFTSPTTNIAVFDKDDCYISIASFPTDLVKSAIKTN